MLQEDEHPEKKKKNIELVTKKLSGMLKRENHDEGGS